MESSWVGQMEGFLLKRGAGYVPEGAQGRDSIAGRKSKTKRRGTLIRKGAGEKKRFFTLVTMAADGEKPPKAELRYYTGKKAEDATPKGVVVLEPNMSIRLVGHSTMRLMTKARTYHLRPDKSTGDPSSAAARTTAGKWIHAIEFAINGLKAWQLAGTSDVSAAMHPVTRISTKLSPEQIEAERERVANILSAGMEEKPPVMKKDKPSARTVLLNSEEQFESIWDTCGLQGYNTVVAHFGPVQIDLHRMEQHLQVRAKLVRAELQLFEKQNYKATSATIDEQKTTASVLNAVFLDLKRRTDKGQAYLATLDNEIIKPVQKLRAKIEQEVDSVVKMFHPTVQNLERLNKGVQDLTTAVEEIEGKIHEHNQGSGYVEKRSLFRRPSAGSFSQAQEESLAGLQEDLDATKEALEHCQKSLHHEELKAANRMKQALRSLHSLEIERLNTMGTVLEKLMLLENQVFKVAEKYFQPTGETSVLLEQINPTEDVNATAERLLRTVR